MKTIILLSLFTGFTGCGINLKQDTPVEVNVNHKLDLSGVEEYFERACRADNPGFNEKQVNDCVDDFMVDFIESFEGNL